MNRLTVTLVLTLFAAGARADINLQDWLQGCMPAQKDVRLELGNEAYSAAINLEFQCIGTAINLCELSGDQVECVREAGEALEEEYTQIRSQIPDVSGVAGFRGKGILRSIASKDAGEPLAGDCTNSAPICGLLEQGMRLLSIRSDERRALSVLDLWDSFEE